MSEGSRWLNRKNASWFFAYWLLMLIQMIFLGFVYYLAVSNLQTNRTKQTNIWQRKEDQASAARDSFLGFIAYNQTKLKAVATPKDPIFIDAQNLLLMVDPDLVLMLGATKDNCRDLMLTTKGCSNNQSCLQCLLLLKEAATLDSLRIGLGPHPHSTKLRFGEFHTKNGVYRFEPKTIRYLAARSQRGIKLTLFCDEFVNQDSWSKGFSEFSSTYKPSDSFLDQLLGEYLRKRVNSISLKSQTDPAYKTAQPCFPSEEMRAAVAQAGNIPVVVPVVSIKTATVHTIESEEHSNRSSSGWYQDRINWSYYLQVYEQRRARVSN